MLMFSAMAMAQAPQKQTQAIDDGKGQIFTVVEKDPEYPGGMEALYQFLAANLKYPQGDTECNGKVYVTFVIEKDGTVDNIKILRDPCPKLGTGEEVMRVVKLMPKWKPGYVDGKPVRVQYNLPIMFSRQ